MLPANKRRHFFINKSLQGHYIGYSFITLAVIALAAGVSLYFGIWNSVLQDFSNENIKSRLELSTRLQEYAAARSESSPEELSLSLIEEVSLYAAREREVLNEILATTYKRLAPLLGVLFFLIAWGSVFITHKIAGPLFRLEDSLRKMATGKLNFRISLRKHDEARELAPLFNACIEKLDRSVSTLKKTQKELEHHLSPQKSSSECVHTLAALRAELNRYETTE